MGLDKFMLDRENAAMLDRVFAVEYVFGGGGRAMGESKRTTVAGPLAILAGVLFMVAGVISGNYGLWVPIGALWLIIGAAALRRGRSGGPPPAGG